MQYEILEQYQISAKHADTILQDADIVLSNKVSYNKYPKKLRLVRVWDHDNERELLFLTNNRSWTAKTISQLYKARWEVEIFFKQIKQHLKIKSFVGTSENAVMIQIWPAMITILLLSYLKVKAKFG
jgi:IS4 transposase